jgi:5-methylcytosine-specific restriction endonuclease McrA
MGKKLPYTPKSQIVSALRKMWLWSRERGAAIKREENKCQCCGKKGSVAKGKEIKIEVHHLDSINWDELIKYIRKHLLVNPDRLEVLCKKCHKEEKHDAIRIHKP